jgi:hypothetical protein
VDTEGLVLKAKIHSARVHDEDGIKLLDGVRADRAFGSSFRIELSDRAFGSSFRIELSRLSSTCGWTPATGAEAESGPRRFSG